jgi:uncharacterized protein YkwD
MGRFAQKLLPALLASLVLAACGGGGGGGGGGASSNAAQSPSTSATLLAQEPNAPQVTGDTATDGFNWFNFRRTQAGLKAVSRNGKINVASQGHSNYQKLNDTITHYQTQGNPGFTGVDPGARLAAAGYTFPQNNYAYGEVISSSSDPSGFTAADNLVAAIYHRFVVLDPMYKEAGAGAAVSASGLTYFTTDFAAIGLDQGLGAGKVAVYPTSGQSNVPANFFSNNELPDPVPDRNEVGYPISVHADIINTVTVQTFTVRPRGGTPLQVRLLDRASDPNMQSMNFDSAAAIVPLSPLAAGTTYDVQFVGTAGGVAVTRSWSFTTR